MNNIYDYMNSDYNQIIDKLVTDLKTEKFSVGKWNENKKSVKSVLLKDGK